MIINHSTIYDPIDPPPGKLTTTLSEFTTLSKIAAQRLTIDNWYEICQAEYRMTELLKNQWVMWPEC